MGQPAVFLFLRQLPLLATSTREAHAFAPGEPEHLLGEVPGSAEDARVPAHLTGDLHSMYEFDALP